MRYISSRGQCPAVDFETAVMTGLAPDGGLYIPSTFPRLTEGDLKRLQDASFVEVAATVLKPFVTPSLDEQELEAMLDKAWESFRLDTVTYLRPLQDAWLLELFHGPTFAFKDVALQLLGHIFDHFLAKRQRSATVLGATSGDTGSAAIAGCRGRKQLRIVILHPHERTSLIQRRQMTTITDANVTNLALRGDFDDCQAIVKELFGDPVARNEYGLTAVNSINIARVLAQMVYYVQSSVQLWKRFGQAIDFCVPTGNFGDILAGHWARVMGAPIGRLVIATNQNDILSRLFEQGRYETDEVSQSLSPSMDIQVSSNFERLLYELGQGDPHWVRTQMTALYKNGGFSLGEAATDKLRRGFAAGRCDDTQTLAEIKKTFVNDGVTLDPHTAVARAVARNHQTTAPMVILATAHPAKFPGAVQKATGQPPTTPQALKQVLDGEERFEVIEANAQAVRAVLQGLSTATKLG
ncbi:MAG TPA: threonine synthase [Myxococcales bacterium]|nr:threonine synthase [Myxococcales bacterium]HAN30068.1 threonine synthase [Myxococcales bacterium]